MEAKLTIREMLESDPYAGNQPGHSTLKRSALRRLKFLAKSRLKSEFWSEKFVRILPNLRKGKQEK
jgi:hypothetical protein